ncbi:MAG TPA: hypothetical protein DDW70_05015 [Rikenellaceae bacterium]|nr:hypothetical protein [Rikenellaceae bacterium]
MDYLEKRQYDYIRTGSKKAAYKEAFRQLACKNNVGTILVDTGSRLGNVLLNAGLVDEISLIFSPEILGKNARHLFDGVEKSISLRCKKLPDGYF